MTSRRPDWWAALVDGRVAAVGAELAELRRRVTEGAILGGRPARTPEYDLVPAGVRVGDLWPPPCPACSAPAGAPCVRVAGARIRGGVHPARRPVRPRGRPATVAYRATLELTADELARVNARRGERSVVAYLRGLIPGRET